MMYNQAWNTTWNTELVRKIWPLTNSMEQSPSWESKPLS